MCSSSREHLTDRPAFTDQTTFPARLKILLQPLALSSDATVPVMRVPSGSFLLFKRMHALSSKRTTLPSALCSSFFVRTTTA